MDFDCLLEPDQLLRVVVLQVLHEVGVLLNQPINITPCTFRISSASSSSVPRILAESFETAHSARFPAWSSVGSAGSLSYCFGLPSTSSTLLSTVLAAASEHGGPPHSSPALLGFTRFSSG